MTTVSGTFRKVPPPASFCAALRQMHTERFAPELFCDGGALRLRAGQSRRFARFQDVCA